MRYALVSDIHGNLSAWNTVLSDISLRKVDRILCMGDVVGYGPQPAECLSGVYAHCTAMVLGNHDAVVAGLMDPSVFNDRAQRAIAWTQTRLGQKARAVFSKVPLVIKGPNFRCTHGSFDEPAVFDYVRTPEDAARSFATVPEQLLFCGHTHCPAFFIVGESGNVHQIEPQDFVLEDGKRYLINVGSVGSSRDGNPRASYVIYDEEKRSVYFHRISYDLNAFRAAVAAAPGLDPEDVQLLRSATMRQNESSANAIREELDFAPSSETRAVTSSSTSVTDLTRALATSRRRLRIAVLLCAIAVILTAAISFLLASSSGPQEVLYPAKEYPAISAQVGAAGASFAYDGNLLPPLAPSMLAEGGVTCPPFQIRLEDARFQSVSVDSENHLVFKNLVVDGVSEPHRFAVYSPLISELGKERIEAMARIRLSDDFQGSFTLQASYLDANNVEHPLFQRDFSNKAPGMSEKAMPKTIRSLPFDEAWLLARGTADSKIPVSARGVYVKLAGEFTGSVTVGAISARTK